jgi:hypothetical protein
MFDPVTLLAAVAPLLVEGGKAAISRWIAPDTFKPSSMADVLALRAADTDLFRAMNEAGGTNQSYPWVEAVVRLMRPCVAAVVMLTWAGQHWAAVAGADLSSVDNFAASVGFYLFADRTLFYARQGMKP